MPEAQSIIEDYNGFYFEENNLGNLVYKINKWLFNSKDRKKTRNNCYEIIDKYYNPNYQVSVINKIINNEIPEI